MVGLSQELRPKVQVSYWYSLNTHRRIVLSKQGYVKVDENLPKRVVLVVDCIVQRSRCNSPMREGTQVRSYHTVIKEIAM